MAPRSSRRTSSTTTPGRTAIPSCVEESDTCLFESPYCCDRGVDLRDAITVSSDTYFYRLGGEGFFRRRQPLDEGIQESARAFGLGSYSGVPLPHERPGVVPDREYYDYQFEQGVFLRGRRPVVRRGTPSTWRSARANLLTTPLQVANAYAVLASDGKLHQPNIATRITDRKRTGPRGVRSPGCCVSWNGLLRSRRLCSTG